MNNLVIDIIKISPPLAKKAFRKLRLHKLVAPFIDKHAAELAFQIEWAREFEGNRDKVLEYWKNYRYLDEINQILDLQDKSRVLDVGCGISTVLHFLKGDRYGIDPLGEEYKRIYTYPEGIQVTKADGENIPFADKYFDAVFCTNVLDHVTGPRMTIDNISRVLKDDGYFVLTVELFDDNVKRDAAHPHSLTRTDIVGLLQDHFDICLEKESPWIGLRRYVNGKGAGKRKELVLVMKKAH